MRFILIFSIIMIFRVVVWATYVLGILICSFGNYFGIFLMLNRILFIEAPINSKRTMFRNM